MESPTSMNLLCVLTWFLLFGRIPVFPLEIGQLSKLTNLNVSSNQLTALGKVIEQMEDSESWRGYP